ncbi:MAG: lysine--tRNA ligase [Acidimicrobiia bacterium]|nr:MAG: lysine--tRNA ligase [Acidimicrobiia bacterium]
MSDEPTVEETHEEETNRLVAIRRGKLRAILDEGRDPFPVGLAAPTDTAAELHATHGGLGPGEETGIAARVGGRIINIRSFGKLRFAVLQDPTGTIQLFVAKGALSEDDFARFDALDHGDLVVADGEVMTTKKGELSLKVTSFELAAKSLRPLPDKWHGLQDKQTRFRRRYLDLIVNEDARRIAVARARIVAALRKAYADEGYLEVETPMLQVQPGGAIARPFTTHHNALDIDMYLRIAPELYLKRLVVGGLDRVFEVNRNFRNEGIDQTHNPEFTMLEAYAAWYDAEDVMAMCERAIASVATEVLDSMTVEFGDTTLDLTAPWPRRPMADLVSAAVGEAVSAVTPVEQMEALAEHHGIEVKPGWGSGKLLTELFEELVEPHLVGPVFVVDYPVETSPLARVHREKEGVTERFELFIGGWEIANGFTELNDPIDQRRRFEAQAAVRDLGDDEAHVIDEDYLLALEHGMPPTGGIGIGVDRLVMLLTNTTSIREVVLFPHLRPE